MGAPSSDLASASSGSAKWCGCTPRSWPSGSSASALRSVGALASALGSPPASIFVTALASWLRSHLRPRPRCFH